MVRIDAMRGATLMSSHQYRVGLILVLIHNGERQGSGGDFFKDWVTRMACFEARHLGLNG